MFYFLDLIAYICYIAGYVKKEEYSRFESREKSVRRGLGWFFSILAAFICTNFICYLGIINRFKNIGENNEILLMFGLLLSTGLLTNYLLGLYYTEERIKLIAQKRQGKLSIFMARLYLIIFFIIYMSVFLFLTSVLIAEVATLS